MFAGIYPIQYIDILYECISATKRKIRKKCGRDLDIPFHHGNTTVSTVSICFVTKSTYICIYAQVFVNKYTVNLLCLHTAFGGTITYLHIKLAVNVRVVRVVYLIYRAFG